MVAYLKKSKGSEGFHQIIDFLNASHLQYALTRNPTIYVSFIKQFWRTATARTRANGEVELTATIDGQVKTITEASLRRHLKLEDNGGVTTLPNSEIFEQLALMSPKKTSWEQFSSNIATAIICLATNGTYNFSKMIFDAMVNNVDSTYKFLMYPRFIQICLNMQKRHLQPHTRTYAAHSLTNKVFSNMKRVSRGYSGVEFPIFPTMLTAPETSPSRITYLPFLSPEPSLSPQHTPVSTPSTSQPLNTQPTPDAEEAARMPHESPLQSVYSLGRDEGSLSLTELMVLCTSLSKKVESLESELKKTKQTYSTALTKLIKRVKKLEQTIKRNKARRRAKIVVSEDEDSLEDSSKYIAEETSWIQEDADIQIRTSNDTEVLLEEEEPTELVEDHGSGEKGEGEVSTAKVQISTVSATPEVSTAAENLVYIRRSAEKRKDKEQFNEEESQRIARDAEIAKQLQEEINIAGQEEVVAKDDEAHDIDWSDSAGGYKMKHFKGMSYEDIRPIFERVWDQIHSFVLMDSELEVQRLKRKGQEVQEEPAKRQRTGEVSESVQEQTDEEPKTDELSQEQLNQMIIIVPEEGMHVEALQTKYPIIDWEVYSEDIVQFWKIIRVGNRIEIYQVFEDMLKNFDREDLLKLWSLVKKRINLPGLTEDKEKELWVELKMLFEPDEENLLELQRYMHDPLKWWLYDTCVVHHVSTERGQDIFMMVEKDYPLTKGLATLMLCNKLRVDQHSEMADEILTKIFNIANRARQ
ncbi:hypothetical protein Tco_1069853 [Tanacetum coccineum]|uniref:Xylulose kinase-1 n=1 Tax=Tanacetum coccineum TaxID=301880 RepID=A0ABQ5HL69_9ASTR